jgi:hypothetical protein
MSVINYHQFTVHINLFSLRLLIYQIMSS